MSSICLFTYCRLEYIKLGSPNDPMWSDFPQTLMQMQGARRYVTLFESPFVGSNQSERENNALRASSLLAVPPPPPEVSPLEGIQGVNLPDANLTQWASYVQDVAWGMLRPPCAATNCHPQDMAGVLYRLENLTRVGFCHLCYTLGSNCGCSRATHQAPRAYGDQALWVPPKPSYALMASSTITTTRTSLRGVSPTAGPPPGFPARGAPLPMDVSPAQKSYNLLVQAGVGRGLWPQFAVGPTWPRTPGAMGLHQEQPSALCQQAAASGSHEVTPATPYQQMVHPPWQVRFASPVTKAEATTSQSQSVAERGRSQTREHGGHQEQASHSRGRKDRSSTQGPKRRRGITSKDPMEDLMDFIPSGWKRDLTHMVGCFYASQVAPLTSQQWYSDRDAFIRAMEERKDHKWLDIKELTPLRYMRYVAKCFQDTTGHNLKGLGLHTKWIWAQSYYHWKVAELDQLQHCPHLLGLPVPLGPMEHPSALQQPQRPSRQGAVAPGVSGSSGVGGLATSKSSGEPSWMEGGAGDGSSWFDWVKTCRGRAGCLQKKEN